MTEPAAAPSPSPKHQQIVQAAGALFIELGYGQVSMDLVAKRAQVSKATLYAHFASKDRLFATVVGDACRRSAVDEGSFPVDVPDIAAALRQIGDRLLRFLLLPATMAIYRVVVAESTRFPELGEAFMAAGPQVFLDRFTLWLRAQSDAGRLAIDDPALAAEQFGALLRTTRFLRATVGVADPHDTEATLQATVAATVEIFLRRYGAAQEN